MMNFPKDNASFSWTRHIKNKMVFYHLSGAQILRIFRKPKRREEGVAPDTVAAMASKKSVGANNPKQEELWIMYKINKKKGGPSKLSTINHKPSTARITMISAWRYPGITKAGEHPPIPEDVLAELAKY